MTERSRQARSAVDLLNGRWTLPLLEMADRGRRYQEFHQSLDGISYKVLTETLRRVERDGLVVRRLDGERIETATLYEITDLGRSLDEPLSAKADWVVRNWAMVESARQRWDQLT